MTVLLAIETSQRSGSVAIARGAEAPDEEPLRGRHDEDLIAAIDRLRARLEVPRHALDAVAVSVGPGGFTGLRVGIATAKMLAFALGVPAVPVPTAQVVAERIEPAGTERDLLVVLAVKDDRFWATRLAPDGTAWRIVGAPGSLTARDLNLEGIAMVAGDRFLPTAVRRAAEAAGVRMVEPAFSAEACARAGLRAIAAGRTVDAAHLQPIYARPPQVTVKAKV